MRYAFFMESVPITPGVLSGVESLGGSESACIGLMRGLAARGHDVHCFAMKLDPACQGRDRGNVLWHDGATLYEMAEIVHWDVFISLRMSYVFQRPIRARLRLLWNQDMLIGEPAMLATMAVAWQFDHLVYVSEYHRAQWEAVVPDLKPIGLVAKNGYDAALVPEKAEKRWNQIIHISRPERALGPILAMWPAVKAACPEAELKLCRYSSMYDAQGWGRVCAQYDDAVKQVNEEVGGITYLGELGKPALYQAIAESAVMWYPGVVDFAETSSVAAIEAQAMSTPLVCSAKGALPETAPAATFIGGDAYTPEYQAKSVKAVVDLLHACRDQKFSYRQKQKAGRAHVEHYTYDAVAEQWEQMIVGCFQKRHDEQPMQVLASMLYEDDHTAAVQYAERLLAEGKGDPVELGRIIPFCHKVNAGLDQSAENYGDFAGANPLMEWDNSPRFHKAAQTLSGVTNLLDVACGNGAFALGFARTFPEARVVGIDYSAKNIERANAFAAEAGLADRCTFYCRSVWDMVTQQPDPDGQLDDLVTTHGPFTGLFAGEILEHVANAPLFIDMLEQYVAPGATCVYTVPTGPFIDLLERGIPLHKGHVHHFEYDDIATVFANKGEVNGEFYDCGYTLRGHIVGHWIVKYAAHRGGDAQPRNYAHRILTQRPKPKLTVGLIVKNGENDLGRCLASVWPVADEIIVGDTGSWDDTKTIAAKYGALVINLPSVHDDPDGFAGARNKVLQASTGDWFLWIDADETLVDGYQLWRFIESGPTYRGYQLHQTHLFVDAAPTFDKPVRLFRTGPDVQFYGCVHEQPQMKDCNGDIWPTLDLLHPIIAHTGYLTEDTRRHKMLARNRALLKRDAERFKDRRLGKLLWVREFAQEGQLLEEQEGQGHPKAAQMYTLAVALYEQNFADPSDKFHALGRPFYETALRRINGAMEFDLALAGRRGGIPADSQAKRERVWCRSLEDFERLLQHKIAQMKKQHNPASPLVDPVVPWAEASAEQAVTA